MEVLRFVLFVATIFSSGGEVYGNVPPECPTAINLTDSWRQDHNGSGILPDGVHPNCDTSDMIEQGRPWFRFTGDAGNMLLDHCPIAHSCGTHAGLWSDDEMPIDVGVSTPITGYLGWNGQCDFMPKPMSVMKCSDNSYDFIYKYDGGQHCFVGFCGMTKSSQPVECLSAINLTEYWRQDHNAMHIRESPNGTYGVNCDSFDDKPWFRFSGDAGNMLYNECPPAHSCGTNGAGWSDDPMPEAVGVITPFTLKISWKQCSRYSRQMSVMRCSSQVPYDFIYRAEEAGICNTGVCGMTHELTHVLQLPDECKSAINLTESWRQDHDGTRILPDGSLSHCDTSEMIDAGRPWFRFSGDAGNMMYDQCPPAYSCGTHAAGWTNATMPTEVGVASAITVEFGWYGQCNFRPSTMYVMRCSNEPYDFIYKYHGSDHCVMGFCGVYK